MADISLKVGTSGAAYTQTGVRAVRVPDGHGGWSFFQVSGGSADIAALVDRSITSVSAADLDGITKVGAYAFANCASLTQAVIPEGVTEISTSAFNLSSISTLDLPSTLTVIGGNAFAWTSIRSLTVRAASPPTLASTAFTSADTSNLIIYVPAASVAAYKAASGWSSYASKIQAIA